MKNVFRTDKIWFKTVAIFVICLFLFNEHAFAFEVKGKTPSVNTLSPVSRFHPVVNIEKSGDNFIINEDLGEKTEFSEGFREDIGFVYLNLLVSQVLDRYEDEISAQGLKRLIEKHLSHVDFTRFRWKDMYKEGRSFCLPYIGPDGTQVYTLRYFLPRKGDGNALIAGSNPSGVGEVRFRVEFLEDTDDAIRTVVSLASLGHSSNRRTNMRGAISNALQYSNFILKAPLESGRLEARRDSVEAVLSGLEKCAEIFSTLNTKAQDAVYNKSRNKAPFDEEQIMQWRLSFMEGIRLFSETSRKFFEIKDHVAGELDATKARLLPILEKQMRFLGPLLEDRLLLIETRVSDERVSVNKILENIFEYLEAVPHQQKLKGKDVKELIELDLPEEEVFVIGNEISITSLLCNLIDDSLKYAIDFSGKEALVCIELREKEGQADISIRDNGLGLSEKDIVKMEEPFYTSGGTGIGLTEARLIARDHKGTIKIKSRHISKQPNSHGTTFIVNLPAFRQEVGAYLKLPSPRGYVKRFNKQVAKVIAEFCKPMEEVRDSILDPEEMSWRAVNAHLRKNNLQTFTRKNRPVIHIIDLQKNDQEGLFGFPLTEKKETTFSDIIPVVSYVSENDGKQHIYMTAAFFDDYLHISHLRSSRSQRRLQSLRFAEILDHERFELSDEAAELSTRDRHRTSAMRARYFLDKGETVSSFHKWAVDNLALSEDGRKYIMLLLDEYRPESDEADDRKYEKAFYAYAKSVLPRKQFSSNVQKMAHHLLRVYMHGDVKAFETLCRQQGVLPETIHAEIEEEERRHVLNAFAGFSADRVVTHTHEMDVEIDHSKNIVRKTPKREAPESLQLMVLDSYRQAQERLGGLIADFTIIDDQIYQEKVKPLSDYYIELAESKGEFAWTKNAPASLKNMMAKDIMEKHLECIYEITKRGVVLSDAKPANFGIKENGDIVLLDLGPSSFGSGGLMQASLSSWLLMNTFRFENIEKLSRTHDGGIKYVITDPETVSLFGKQWARIWLELVSGRIVGEEEELEWVSFEDGAVVIDEIKALFPLTQEEAEKEYRRITFVPTEMAKEEILILLMQALAKEEKNVLPGFEQIWNGPEIDVPRGSIGGVFEFLCDMGITSESTALTEEEIALRVGRAVETIDTDIRALYFHLHLIKAANPGEGKGGRKYFLPEYIASRREAIRPLLIRFQKGQMLRPSEYVLDEFYENEIKQLLGEEDRSKGILKRLFFPWELEGDKEDIRARYGDPKVRMFYYGVHYLAWFAGIVPYAVVILVAVLSRIGSAREILQAYCSGVLSGHFYAIGIEGSNFVQSLVQEVSRGNPISISLAAAVLLPAVLLGIAQREHAKRKKALKDGGKMYTGGAYHFSRHPQYFLSACAAAIAPLLCPTPGMTAIFFVFLTSMVFAAFWEEVIVWIDAGEKYLKYKKEVTSRVIPSDMTHFLLYIMTDTVRHIGNAAKKLKDFMKAISPFYYEETLESDVLSERKESPGANKFSTSGIKRVVMDGKVVSFQDFSERIQAASAKGCIFNAELDEETLQIGFRPRIIEEQQQYHHFIRAPHFSKQRTFRAIVNGAGSEMNVGLILPEYPEEKSAELRDAYIRLARVLTEQGFPGGFGIYKRGGEKKDRQLFRVPPVNFADLSTRKLSTEDEKIAKGIEARKARLSWEDPVPEGTLYQERTMAVQCDKYGIHARPAFEISRIMVAMKAQLGVEVRLAKVSDPEKKGRAESYNDLLSLGLQDGDAIDLEIYIAEGNNVWDKGSVAGIVLLAESVFRNVEYLLTDKGADLYLSQITRMMKDMKIKTGEQEEQNNHGRTAVVFIIGIVLSAITAFFVREIAEALHALWETIFFFINGEEPAEGLQKASMGGMGFLGILAGLHVMLTAEERDPESAPYTVYTVISEHFAEEWVSAEEVSERTIQQYPDKNITFQDVEQTLDLLIDLQLIEICWKNTGVKFRATGLSPPEWGKVEPLLLALEDISDEDNEDEFSAFQAECLQECETEEVCNIETICEFNSSGQGHSDLEKWGIFNATPTLWAMEIIHYIEMIEPEAKIADLGSGDGKFCFLASRSLKEVTGIEARSELCVVAHNNQQELAGLKPVIPGVNNVVFKNADFLDEAIDLSGYDILYFFYTSPKDIPTDEYNEKLMAKMTGSTGLKPGARLILLGAGAIEFDSDKIENESVNILGMALGIYRRKEDELSRRREIDDFVRVLSLGSDPVKLETMSIVNGAAFTPEERKSAAKNLTRWFDVDGPAAVVHKVDMAEYIMELEQGEEGELSDLYFVLGKDGEAIEGWVDLSFRGTLSALEIAPWNRSTYGPGRKYKGLGPEFRAFAIKKLKDKYGDAVYAEQINRIITLGHKDGAGIDEFEGRSISREMVESFLEEQARKRAEFEKKYSDKPPVYTYPDLIAEGYVIEETPIFNDNFQVPEVRVRISQKMPGGESQDQLADISFRIIEETKTIVINSFYPRFPNPANGRGRALLRHLLVRPEYAGYHVIAYALEPFQKSFIKMEDFQPMSDIEQDDSSVYDRIGKTMIKEMETYYGVAAFTDKPDLFDSLKEDWMAATIYGIVPAPVPAEILRIEEEKENSLATGYPYEIFQVLRRHPSGMSEKEMLPYTRGRMEDGRLSEETIRRDYGILKKLGLIYKEGQKHKAVLLSREEWEGVKGPLKALGKRPSAVESDAAVKLLRKSRAEALGAQMSEEMRIVTRGERRAAICFNKEDLGELLTDKNVRAIEKAISRNRRRVENMRALYVTLPEAITEGERKWTKVYIKGIVFDEKQMPVPHNGEGYAGTRFRAEGAEIKRIAPEPSPHGAMTFWNAQNEFYQHKEIYNNDYLKQHDIFVSGPVGYGFFPDAEYYKGQFLGFVILGVDEDMPERDQVMRDDNVFMWARALRLLHDAGFHHPYFHAGNISWTDKKTYIHDLDQAEYLAPEQDNLKQLFSLQVRDVYLWYRHNLHKYFAQAQEEGSSRRRQGRTLQQEAGEGYLDKFLQGYFYGVKPIFYDPLFVGLVRAFEGIEEVWTTRRNEVLYEKMGGTNGRLSLSIFKNYLRQQMKAVKKNGGSMNEKAPDRGERGQASVEVLLGLTVLSVSAVSLFSFIRVCGDRTYLLGPTIALVAASVAGSLLFRWMRVKKTEKQYSGDSEGVAEETEAAPGDVEGKQLQLEKIPEEGSDAVPVKKKGFYTAGSLHDLLYNFFPGYEVIRGIDMGAGDGMTTRIFKDLMSEIFPRSVFVGLDKDGGYSGTYDISGLPVQIYDVSQFKKTGVKPDLDLITMFAPYPEDLEMFISTAKGLISKKGLIMMVFTQTDIEDLFDGKRLFGTLDPGLAWNLLRDFKLVRLESINDDVMMRYGHPFVFVYSPSGFKGEDLGGSLFGGDEGDFYLSKEIAVRETDREAFYRAFVKGMQLFVKSDGKACYSYTFILRRLLKEYGIRSEVIEKKTRTGSHFFLITEDKFLIDAFNPRPVVGLMARERNKLTRDRESAGSFIDRGATALIAPVGSRVVNELYLNRDIGRLEVLERERLQKGEAIAEKIARVEDVAEYLRYYLLEGGVNDPVGASLAERETKTGEEGFAHVSVMWAAALSGTALLLSPLLARLSSSAVSLVSMQGLGPILWMSIPILAIVTIAAALVPIKGKEGIVQVSDEEESVNAAGLARRDEGPFGVKTEAQTKTGEAISSYEGLISLFLKDRNDIHGVDLGTGLVTKTEDLYDVLKPHFNTINYRGLESKDEWMHRAEGKRVTVAPFDPEEPTPLAARRTQDLVTVFSPPPSRTAMFIERAKELVRRDGLVVLSFSKQDLEELFAAKEAALDKAPQEIWDALEGFRRLEITDEKDPFAKMQQTKTVFIYSPGGTARLPVETFSSHNYTGDRIYKKPGVFDNDKLSYLSIDHLREKGISLEGKQVWDLGTGAGIMGIYAARDGAEVIATDIKKAACESAQRNVSLAGLDERIKVRKGAFDEALSDEEKFDYIFCDPPIFSTKKYSDDPNVYDGKFALVKKILTDGLARLKEGGALIMVYPGSRAVINAEEEGLTELFFVVDMEADLASRGFTLQEEKVGGFFSVWSITREKTSEDIPGEEIGHQEPIREIKKKSLIPEQREEVLLELDIPADNIEGKVISEKKDPVGQIDDMIYSYRYLLRKHSVIVEDLAAEMAINTAEHGKGGDLKISCVYSEGGTPLKIRIIARDKGPGLPADPDEIVRRALETAGVSERGRGLVRITFDPTEVRIESNGKLWIRNSRDRANAVWYKFSGVSDIVEGTRVTAEFDLNEEISFRKMGMAIKKTVIDGERYTLDVVDPGKGSAAFIYAQKSEEHSGVHSDQIGIRGISTASEYRGQGIAKQLFREFLEEFPEIKRIHAAVRNPLLLYIAQKHFQFVPVDPEEKNAVYMSVGEKGEKKIIWIPDNELRFEYEFGSEETMKDEFIVVSEAPEMMQDFTKLYFNTLYYRWEEPAYLASTKKKILEKMKIRGVEARPGGSFGSFAARHFNGISGAIGVYDLGSGTGNKLEQMKKELAPHFGKVHITGFDNDLSLIERAQEYERNVKYFDVRAVADPVGSDAKRDIITIVAPRPKDMQNMINAAKKLVADNGLIVLALLGEEMLDLLEGHRVNNEVDNRACWDMLSDFELVRFDIDENRVWSAQGNNVIFIYSPKDLGKTREESVDTAGGAEKEKRPGSDREKEVMPELAKAGKNNKIEETFNNKKEHMSLKDISYTELGLENVDAIIADFDGVDRDQSLKEVSELTIELKRALSARGVHNITVTGLDLPGFLYRFGGENRASRISNGEEYMVLSCTGAVGHVFKANGLIEDVPAFEQTQIGTVEEREEMKTLLGMSVNEVLKENGLDISLASTLSVWVKEQQVTLETRPIPEVNALRYKIAARLTEKLEAASRFAHIEVICSGGAIDIAALTKASAAIKMIKALRLKKIVLAGDSAGTKEEPGNDRSFFEMTGEDLVSGGIDWEVELIKLYVGKEENYDLPEDVIVAEEDACETQPMIDVYTGILQAKAAQELKDVLIQQDFDAAKNDETVIIGIESSWVPGLQAAAVQGLLSALTRKGLNNVRIVRGSGESLAGEIEEAMGETNAELKNVIILGANEIVTSGIFDVFRSDDGNIGAFFAGIDLPENFPENGYTRLFEMLSLAVKMAFGDTSATDPYIETVEEGKRSYRFIPRVQAFEFKELKKIYTLQKQLLTAA